MRKNLTYLFILFSFLFINHCTQQKVSEKEVDIALYSDKGADEKGCSLVLKEID